MPVSTRRQRQLMIIDAWNQNGSRPVYRLSPELISEIFLQARPDVFARQPNRAAAWGRLVRYLITITSIASHFRRIALNCGELWSVVGFSLVRRKHCKNALALVEAFLERAKGCSLHFFFRGTIWSPPPTWFSLKLAELISPHVRRARTFDLSLGGSDSESAWKRHYSLLNDAVNIRKLSLVTEGWYRRRRTLPPLQDIHALHNLNELSVTGSDYDESFREVLGVVEVLHLDLCDEDLRQWLGSSIRLKRLIIWGIDYTVSGPKNSNSLLQLENLMYLEICVQLYPSIASRLSLPCLRHLHLTPFEEEIAEPQLCHHPLLRTLYIPLEARNVNVYKLLILSNPQLEYLEINCGSHWLVTLELLSRLSHPSQGLVPPSGAAIFPGPSLKYLRLTPPGPHFHRNVELSKHLSSILSKALHLELGISQEVQALISEGLDKQFPSKVKDYRDYRVPLDELYERVERDNA